MDGLFAMYPEADRACKNPAHFFYGTNKPGQVLNPKALSLDLFLSVLESDKIKGGGRLRNIEPQSPGAAFLRKDGFLAASYSNTIGARSKATDEQKVEYYEHLKKNKKNKAVDWDKLQSRIRLFFDFMHSEERLSYAQLVGLAQNLVWMQGGQQIYEQRLQEFNDNHIGNNPYQRDGRFELVRKMNKYNKYPDTAYFPQRLKNFSPYPSDHRYQNLITAERDLLEGIVQTEPINRMSLGNAEQLLEYKFSEAMDSLDDDIYIFRLPTGIGKTHRIKDLPDATLAFPTNDLKQQVYDDRDDLTSAIMTPEFPTFTDDILNEKINRLFKAGFVKQVHRLLWDFKKGKGCSLEDQKIAQEYINRNAAVQHHTGSIFTTHTRALHTPFYHDTIIFDEDPLPLLLDVDTLKVADLKKVNRKTGALLFGHRSTSLLNLQRFLEGATPGEIMELPDEYKIDVSGKWVHFMHTGGMDSNIIKFLDCLYFYKDESDRDKIHFIHHKDLPTDKKVIIMSATVPVEIYKQLYGQRAQVIDITDVAHTGTITQHMKYSYSRNSLAKRLDEANTKLPNRPTITFKSFNDQVDHASPTMWFGNCSGYNDYTGQSINVLGTPHKHNAQYLLIGKVLGVNVDHFNREFKLQPVD